MSHCKIPKPWKFGDMEIHSREEGGEYEMVFCPTCSSNGLDPIHQEGATGAPSWGMMTRLAVRCSKCGDETRFSWPGRIKFRFVRRPESV